jgi:hypothetical protein
MSKKLGGQEPIRIDIHDPNDLKGTLQHVGGSRSDAWNNIIINQAVRALWIKHSDEEALGDQRKATVLGLAGIGPKDELEGMLAAQLLAAHNASMECYRRGMLGEQTFEGRRENLAQANKLSRTYSMLVDSLNRHRGKGQQKVTVEHVHVNAGGQAVVGTVEHRGGGVQSKSEDQPDAKQLTNASQLPMWSEDKERESVPVARDAERPLPDARRTISGRSEGE